MSEDQIINALNLGTSRAALDGKPNSPLAQLLTLQANEIVADLRQSLDKYDASASGNLQQDMLPSKVSVKGGEVSIAVEAPFYWKFVNYGVNGTLVNRGAPSWGAVTGQSGTMSYNMKQWERDRGITYVGGVSSWTSKSHVEGMSMAERGQIGRPFFTDVVNNTLIDSLAEPITKLMGRAITIKIIEPWQ